MLKPSTRRRGRQDKAEAIQEQPLQEQPLKVDAACDARHPVANGQWYTEYQWHKKREWAPGSRYSQPRPKPSTKRSFAGRVIFVMFVSCKGSTVRTPACGFGDVRALLALCDTEGHRGSVARPPQP